MLTNCSTHTVKLGKKCTKLASDNTYEKSYVWIINKGNLETFDDKINKENERRLYCLENYEKGVYRGTFGGDPRCPGRLR